MSVLDVISLLGGLALFLYGMSMLGEGLENASGGKLERVLEKLTGHLPAAVLLGAVTTAAIQSSSATTVIVVGLVNAKLITLRRAIGVIMGANIGTTVTGQILRLADIGSDNLFLLCMRPTTLAPLAAFVGILVFLGSRRSHNKNIGMVLLGFAVLFTGMFAMEQAVSPLRGMPEFASFFAALSHPVLGVLAGAAVTAIIQSSSASVGILQALSSTGQITCATAFPIIMGQNIGTCITPILASIGASKNAKRAAAVHLFFNLIGTLVFLAGTYGFHCLVCISCWEEVIDRGGIADFHTLFNVVCTLLFLPFVGVLERLACIVVKDGRGARGRERTVLLEKRLLGSPVLALDQGMRAMASMTDMVRVALRLSVGLYQNFQYRRVERIQEHIASVDKLIAGLEEYLLQLSQRVLLTGDSRAVAELMNMTIELRHMTGDIGAITGHAAGIYDKRQTLSEGARTDLGHLGVAVGECLRLTTVMLTRRNPLVSFAQIQALRTTCNQLADLLKERHIVRLRNGTCTMDVSFVFAGIVARLCKIADHCANIALMSRDMASDEGKGARLRFASPSVAGTVPGYDGALHAYRRKYVLPLQGNSREGVEPVSVGV